MTRLVFVAAALAAGMTVFAATAQERDTVSIVPVAPKAADGTANAEAGDAKAAKKKVLAAALAADKVAKKADPGVDPVKTSSVVPARTRPDVTFKARKEVKGLADAAKSVASTGRYGAIVARYASAYGVPASLAHAVITVESNYRPDARGSAGEIGLMQIKPATARGMGYRGSAKGLFDPETNIRFGMKYLAKAHELSGGNTCGTILRYNAGHAARRMNPVSAAYCGKVKRHLGS